MKKTKMKDPTIATVAFIPIAPTGIGGEAPLVLGEPPKSDTIEPTSKTPIEIAMGIDDDGRTTVKKLYEWLELDPTHYNRWIETNVTNNTFVDESDFSPLKAKNTGRGRPTQDYRITASLAKKLAMTVKTERGKQARAYFVACEECLKRVLEERNNWRSERAKTIFLRNMLTDAIKNSGENERMHGHAYSNYTDLVYKCLFNKTSKQMKNELGLENRDDLRDHLDAKRLSLVQRMESYIAALVDVKKPYSEVKEKATEYAAALLELQEQIDSPAELPGKGDNSQ